MQNLPNILKAMIKWFFANVGKSLFALTATALVLYFGGIYHVCETIWIYAKRLLQLPMPLWATIGLVFLSGLYIYKRMSKAHSSPRSQKPKYYKYCPVCDSVIDAKNPEQHCHKCGTKYLEKCPICKEKIIRANGRFCSSCGHDMFDRISAP